MTYWYVFAGDWQKEEGGWSQKACSEGEGGKEGCGQGFGGEGGKGDYWLFRKCVV